jgi:CubicO group peptidase (beta-lactamase class C family)
MKKPAVILFQTGILILAAFHASAQMVPDSVSKKIDNIFRGFNDSTPGCAIAIIKDNEVIFEKGYGMANLEYKAPITPKTIFHIASESKQYVAFAMLMLQKEGKLSIDDDIHKYLDSIPDFGRKITIRHLIHHTSGLRDQWQLLANAGWQLDDVIREDHVLKLVAKQQALNFDPGEEYMYCNTGYTLMAAIVKKVTGLSLRAYAEKNIFQPLGMRDTHFHDDYEELVPGRAYSYSLGTRGYKHAVLSYSIVGATSLLTTIQDEAKWLKNFSTGQVGGKDLIEQMHQVGALNDGRKLNYAFGLSIDNFKGWKQVGHGGADAGYRSFACRYPEKGLGFIVFSNVNVVNPTGLARQVAALFITDTKEVLDSAHTNFADSSFHKKLAGNYYSDRGDIGEMTWANGKLLRGSSTASTAPEWRFARAGKNRFVVKDGPVFIINDKNLQSDSIMEFQVESPVSRVVFKRKPHIVKPVTAEYAGRYYSDETEAFYEVKFKEGKLSLEHRKFNKVALQPLAPDQFTAAHWWMGHIRFVRDKANKIIAFEVNSGRILGLRYQKMK